MSSPNHLPFLRNPAILIGKDDLTALSYLHEPADRECIYTYCGIVLVAINPYAECPHLYGEEVIQVYNGMGKQVRELDPHIYAAYSDLVEFNKSQSIIVSGESGAGKTVSAKFVMKFVAVINVGDKFTISGAKMKTYLLEKSRLVFQALDVLGFDQQKQRDIFRILKGILLLGNTDFKEHGNECVVSPVSATEIAQLSDDYKIDEAQLRLWLTTREIRAAGETVRMVLEPKEAVRSRDALAKLIYAQLFCWLVKRCNDALIEKETRTSRRNFIGHVFKLEQEEYEREELSWVRIDYYDNQLAIDLIEGRPGLIDYLNEQCKKNGQLQMPRIKSSKFIIKHFASDVAYSIEGFVEKNKDAISKQLLELVLTTRVSLPVLIAQTTRPHYVRCIKPNDSKEKFYFEPKRAIEQLRACGVLETVRISAAGFPTRWTYEEFARRYRVLYNENKSLWRDKPRIFAERACHKHLEEGRFALGRTKIFFRTGEVALLERVRVEILSSSAIMIQSCWRRYVARTKYLTLRRSLHTIQAATRAFIAVRRLFYLQMHRAVIVIQTCFRRFVCESQYRKLRNAAVLIQAHYRGLRVRTFVKMVSTTLVQLEVSSSYCFTSVFSIIIQMRYESSAITIQKYWRGYLVRREEIRRRKRIVLVQCCVRRWLAKRRLRELKVFSRIFCYIKVLFAAVRYIFHSCFVIYRIKQSGSEDTDFHIPLRSEIMFMQALKRSMV
uniref:Myosin motor domain-containing protein n=1 Tax=Angiostrongylus cantonensis TaxID=6313 RepID=A0A0K0CTA0_ANGCA